MHYADDTNLLLTKKNSKKISYIFSKKFFLIFWEMKLLSTPSPAGGKTREILGVS